MNTNRRGIAGYILIAFGLAWVPLVALWFFGLRAPHENASFLDYAVFLMLTLPTSFAPAVATFVVRKWITREGFSDAGLQLNLKVKWPYYLFALLYPLIVIPFAVALAASSRVGQINLEALSLRLFPQLLLTSLVSTPIIWGEEFGWRGYLQIRLFADRPLLAAVGTGVIWGIWHYPMILMGFVFQWDPVVGMLLYPFNMIFTSLLYGWLRLKTGSVWSASLAHSVGNTIIAPLLTMLLPDVEWALSWGMFRIIGLALICIWIVLSGQFRTAEGRIELWNGSSKHMT